MSVPISMKAAALLLLTALGFHGVAHATSKVTADDTTPQPSDPEEAKPRLWKWCDGKEPEAFKDVEVEFKNYPLVPGEILDIIFRGKVVKKLDKLVVRSQVTINGFFSIADVQNLCRSPWERCPMLKGYQEQVFNYHIPHTLFGTISTKSTLYSNRKAVACMDIGPLDVRRP